MVSNSTLSIADLAGSRILITGASGWLGREVLCLLNRYHPHFARLNLVLLGSQQRRFEVHGEILETISLSDFPKKDNFDLIFHFAFSTQDKAKIQGRTAYIQGNLALNQWISNISERNLSSRKMILSSGAVSKYRDSDDAGTSMEIYADLKRELEARFMEPDSLILRLWNTSGHHMGADSKYALGEFVSKAVRGEPIRIDKNLQRTYVAASSILDSSITYLLNGGHGIVNSGGEQTTLLDLAMQTIEVLSSGSTCSLTNEMSFPELDYVSPTSEIPRIYWNEILNLKDQIMNTALGI